MTTVTSAAASSTAMARPIPREAPVTRATLRCRSESIAFASLPRDRGKSELRVADLAHRVGEHEHSRRIAMGIQGDDEEAGPAGGIGHGQSPEHRSIRKHHLDLPAGRLLSFDDLLRLIEEIVPDQIFDEDHRLQVFHMDLNRLAGGSGGGRKEVKVGLDRVEVVRGALEDLTVDVMEGNLDGFRQEDRRTRDVRTLGGFCYHTSPPRTEALSLYRA